MIIRWIGAAGALLPVLALGFILRVLAVKAWPAIRYNGWGFFTGSTWSIGDLYGQATTSGGVAHLQGARFGALPAIIGTLGTSAIALIVAVPVSIGTALVIVERLPRRLAALTGGFSNCWLAPQRRGRPVGSADLRPLIARHRAVHARQRRIPVLSYFRGDTGNGEGMLVSGLVLAIMIPIVAATTRDLIPGCPSCRGGRWRSACPSGNARGVTAWVGRGIVGVVLGLGRALGEIMAVAMTSGMALGSIPGNVYQAMTTIAATVVQQVDTAFQDGTGFTLRALAELCLVLMVITLATNVTARLLVRRVSGTALPVGRGL